MHGSSEKDSMNQGKKALNIILHVHPVKTQFRFFAGCVKISWVHSYPDNELQTLWLDCIDYRLIWIFAGGTCNLVGNAVP